MLLDFRDVEGRLPGGTERAIGMEQLRTRPQTVFGDTELNEALPPLLLETRSRRIERPE